VVSDATEERRAARVEKSSQRAWEKSRVGLRTLSLLVGNKRSSDIVSVRRELASPRTNAHRVLRRSSELRPGIKRPISAGVSITDRLAATDIALLSSAPATRIGGGMHSESGSDTRIDRRLVASSAGAI
jgi:hypothetical protein